MRDPVLLATTVTEKLRISPLAGAQPDRCVCCDHLAPAGSVAGNALCLTCLPAFALDEPDIDNVAALVWLPHLDQGVLSRLISAVHTACAAEGTGIHDHGLSGRPRAARKIFDTLLAQRAGAIARIGTDRPSTFRAAALSLSGKSTREKSGLSALRFVALGSWFAADPRRYAQAAKAWAGQQ